MKWLVAIVIAAFSAIPSFGVNERFERTVALPVFGGYAPEVKGNADALRQDVLQKVHTMLRESLPPGTYSKIAIVRSCEIQESMLPPHWKTAVRFSLVARIPSAHEKIGGFEFRMDLDAAGQLLNQLELPVLDSQGEMRLADWSAVVRQFREHGLDDVSEGLDLDYSTRLRTLIWRSVKIEKWMFGKKVLSIAIRADDASFVEKGVNHLP